MEGFDNLLTSPSLLTPSLFKLKIILKKIIAIWVTSLIFLYLSLTPHTLQWFLLFTFSLHEQHQRDTVQSSRKLNPHQEAPDFALVLANEQKLTKLFHLNTINQMANLRLQANLPKENFLNEQFSKWTFTELLKKNCKVLYSRSLQLFCNSLCKIVSPAGLILRCVCFPRWTAPSEWWSALFLFIFKLSFFLPPWLR